MTIQSQFDLTINLLKINYNTFPIVKGLIDVYTSSEVDFFCPTEASPGTRKEDILGVYEIRAKINSEANNSTLIFGYDTLLPNLRITKHKYICISNLSSDSGGFLVFSDFDRKELIGVLYTKYTLADRRNRVNDYKKKAEAGEMVPQYNHNENLFVNGKYTKNS